MAARLVPRRKTTPTRETLVFMETTPFVDAKRPVRGFRGAVLSPGRRRTRVRNETGLIREVQPEGLGEESRHLPARHRRVRAEVPASASARDAGGGEGLDELEEGMRRRNVTEGRDGRRRADPTVPPDLDGAEELGTRAGKLLDVQNVVVVAVVGDLDAEGAVVVRVPRVRRDGEADEPGHVGLSAALEEGEIEHRVLVRLAVDADEVDHRSRGNGQGREVGHTVHAAIAAGPAERPQADRRRDVQRPRRPRRRDGGERRRGDHRDRLVLDAELLRCDARREERTGEGRRLCADAGREEKRRAREAENRETLVRRKHLFSSCERETTRRASLGPALSRSANWSFTHP